MKQLLLLGDEAIAQAAMDAGISGMYAYPGTPSSEIMEYIQSHSHKSDNETHAEWSVNEKTAFEEALGMSYTGKRAMVAMKHVGLNVAADPFMNAAITGVNGGLIIVAADDPSMHSSQNEQDSRCFGKFAQIPFFEPSCQQEAYDMVYEAFDLSEKFQVPVLVRITTRMAHSRAGITRSPAIAPKAIALSSDPRQFILLPAIARLRYRKLLSHQKPFAEISDSSAYNLLTEGKDKSLGVIASGIAWNYFCECFNQKEIPFPALKITQYPLPAGKIRLLAEKCKRLLVLEEGYPFIEEGLRGILPSEKEIHGRLDGVISRDGELTPDSIFKALNMQSSQVYEVPSCVIPRPPSFCSGCSHSDLFLALNEAMKEFGKGKVFSDIGCYTLGALPPYNAIYSCVDMGASITMAKGAADAGLSPSVCVIGDSTFTHSGMTGLLDAVIENSPVTIIISDNSTTGMTGGQKSAATGRLENICKGLGVDPDHLITLLPLKKNQEENVAAIKKELLYHGVSVIISQRECIQTAARRHRVNKAEKQASS